MNRCRRLLRRLCALTLSGEGPPDDAPAEHGGHHHDGHTSDDGPPPLETELPGAAERAESKRYHRIALRCSLLDRAIDAAYLAAMAFLAAPALDRALAGLPLLDIRWLRLPALLLIVMALHVAVSFPLAVYAGYVVEHRFGLSTLRFNRWLKRYALDLALALGLTLLLMEGFYALIWLTGPLWWLLAAAAFFAVAVLFGQLMPVLILPLYYRIEPLDDEALAGRLTRLAEGTGLRLSGVYRICLSAETVKANAMLAGLGRTRRVLLGDTLLNRFSPEEIEVVFAHELGHHVHRHLTKLLAVGLLFSPIAFFLCDRALLTWAAWRDGAAVHAELPVYTLPLAMLALTLIQWVFEPLVNGLSRHFERQADRYALTATGDRAAFRSAFLRLARQNKADLDPHPLEVLLFHSHPPIAQRITQAEQ